jgi:hypothetical protein
LGGQHVQLALYARALRRGLSGAEDLAEIRAEYRFVSSRGGFSRRGIVADERVEARLDQAVRRIATGIRGGLFLPVPGERVQNGFQNCRWCEFDRVCATTRDEDWQRKQGHVEAALGGTP